MGVIIKTPSELLDEARTLLQELFDSALALDGEGGAAYAIFLDAGEYAARGRPGHARLACFGRLAHEWQRGNS